MHYLGLVFVDKPTKEAVEEAMADHGGDSGRHWDWYRCGGRYDGWLLGDDEMQRRSTHDGFNFDDSNDNAGRNSCLASQLPPNKVPYFFVADGDFVERQHYDAYAPSTFKYTDGKKHYGAIVDTPDFKERLATALKDHADKYVVVVDAHN